MATTIVYPFKTNMRLNSIITFLVIALFVHSETALNAQVGPDKEGYVDKEIIINDFEEYVNNLDSLPSIVIEGRDELCKDDIIIPFIYKYFPEDDKNFHGVKIRDNSSSPNKEQNLIQLECVQEMLAILKDRKHRDEEMSSETEQTNESESDVFDWRLVALAACIILLVVLVIIYSRIASRSGSQKTKKAPMHADRPIATDSNAQDSGIVVRRKTETVMRKQDLDDAVDNDNYMVIDTSEFCADSSVRRIYIKNSCIKGIYNMYAEDLRNPDNPKEDGCMVLGRWVPDKATGEYVISLEEIVLPGDDAVFTEYELNFGFKISHTVGEKLKKLRRENNRQYDLTCWVHSHPGLGVFFSNFDVNVQAQLKHPSHPNFLIAIVVDILTPKQDLGIFTFKHDASMNAKADLTKFYSLEDWYQWALKSERNSFKQEDHYDTLANAKMHDDSCRNIQLSNSIIIDMSFLMANPNDELVRWIHGFKNYQGEQVYYVASQMSENGNEISDEILGAFVMVPHCSIPSVRKAVASRLKGINFVLVYSTSNGVLTSIPVINNELSTDDNYYAEQNFEDLKIWTRRKR